MLFEICGELSSSCIEINLNDVKCQRRNKSILLCWGHTCDTAHIIMVFSYSNTNVLLHGELLNFMGGLRNLDNKITVSTVACSLVLHVFGQAKKPNREL